MKCQIPKTRIWHCHVQIIRLGESGRNVNPVNVEVPISVVSDVLFTIEHNDITTKMTNKKMLEAFHGNCSLIIMTPISDIHVTLLAKY